MWINNNKLYLHLSILFVWNTYAFLYHLVAAAQRGNKAVCIAAPTTARVGACSIAQSNVCKCNFQLIIYNNTNGIMPTKNAFVFVYLLPLPRLFVCRRVLSIVCDCRQHHCHNICHYRPHIFSSFLSLRFFRDSIKSFSLFRKISKMFILYLIDHILQQFQSTWSSLVHSLNNHRININLILCCDYFICFVLFCTWSLLTKSFVRALLWMPAFIVLFTIIFSYSFLFSSLCNNTLSKFQSQCACMCVKVSVQLCIHGNLIH